VHREGRKERKAKAAEGIWEASAVFNFHIVYRILYNKI